MGTSENFYRELGINVETGEQLNIFFQEAFKKLSWNTGDFGTFSGEHGSPDPLGDSILDDVSLIPFGKTNSAQVECS